MRKFMPRLYANESPRPNPAGLQDMPFSTAELQAIADCPYCLSIAGPAPRTPIQCTKYAGSHVPVSVNPAVCYKCKAYQTNVQEA